MLGVHAEEAAVVVEVVEDGERAIEGVGLWHHPEQRLGSGGMGPHVDSAHEGLPLGGHNPRREHPGRIDLREIDRSDDLVAVGGRARRSGWNLMARGRCGDARIAHGSIPVV